MKGCLLKAALYFLYSLNSKCNSAQQIQLVFKFEYRVGIVFIQRMNI